MLLAPAPPMLLPRLELGPVELKNDVSATALFARVLRVHAGLYDVKEPWLKLDYEHALDTWQWMLRLEPRVGLAPQLAALFHDVERLESGADRRVEPTAPEYQVWKDAHARRAADLAHGILVETGVSVDVAPRVRTLIASHERRGRDLDVDLLNDADALSFFSLSSAGYVDQFGPGVARHEIAFMLRRLGPRARKHLAFVRLRADVAEYVRAVEHA